MDFWMLCAVILWYLFLRTVFFKQKSVSASIFPFFILLGYFQLFFCVFQLGGWLKSFTPLYPVSGTFDNSSELCLFLTCILPVACMEGLNADDSNRKGIFVRVLCLLYILCWLLVTLMLGSRTSLLSGIIGMGVFTGFRSGFWKYLSQKLTTSAKKIFFFIGGLFLLLGILLLLSQFKKDSANGRLLIWKVSLNGICENPFVGQGFNAFQAKYGYFQALYFQQYPNDESGKVLASDMTVGMNDYIEIVFNYGLTGLVLYFLFWFLLFKQIKYESIMRDQLLLVSVSILIIFLVSSGFYFTGRMLPFTLIAFFCAAYISSKSTVFKYLNIKQIKLIASIVFLICCSVIFLTIFKVNHYFKWGLAYQHSQYGYTVESVSGYEDLYPNMKHNGLFLYLYAKSLYENRDYHKCLDCLEKAKHMICSSNFYILFGDVDFQTGDYENAKRHYVYASQIVPNRFIPLYKLFQLYIHTGQKEEALQMAQIIVKKPIKIDSPEIKMIVSNCKKYMQEYKN
jgi:O-antigen ligase